MIERELIAACLTRPNILWQCDCEPEHFASEVHQTIWRAMLDLSRKGEPFDTVTLSQHLGGDTGARVIEYANEAIGTTASAPGYARKVSEAWRNRMAADIYTDAPTRPIDEVIRDLMALHTTADRSECDIKQAMRWALEDMEAAAEAGGRLRGITTGLADLDKHLGGWHNGDLTVIGARPAMGKTALLLHHAQSCGVPMGMMSAEMSAMQLAQRHISSVGKVSLSGLRQGKIGGPEMSAVAKTGQRLRDYWIYDRSSPTITEIERVARRWYHQHGIKILFVDYIQRIRGFGDKRHEQVGDVVRSLKTLARDLSIPVIALAQVGRQVEARSNRRPAMGDLADSSEIEKEADQVLTLYRDEVYNENTEAKGLAEIQIAKNRHGYCGTVTVEWAGEYVSFGDRMWGGA